MATGQRVVFVVLTGLAREQACYDVSDMFPGRLRLLRLAGIGVIGGLLLTMLPFWLFDGFLLPMDLEYPRGFDQSKPYSFKFQELSLTTDDGVVLNAWFIPATVPGSDRVLLVFHGSAINLGYLGRGLLECLTQLGVNVLAIDYRGYGKSQFHNQQ